MNGSMLSDPIFRAIFSTHFFRIFSGRLHWLFLPIHRAAGYCHLPPLVPLLGFLAIAMEQT